VKNKDALNNLDGTAFDLRRVEHHGQLHGTCTKIVHATQLYTLLERLERDGLKVVRIDSLGWVQMEVK
jgi:hypothetical protein